MGGRNESATKQVVSLGNSSSWSLLGKDREHSCTLKVPHSALRGNLTSSDKCFWDEWLQIGIVELCYKSLEMFLVPDVLVQQPRSTGNTKAQDPAPGCCLKSFMKSCFCSAWLCNSHTTGSTNSPDKLDGMDALKFKNSWCFFYFNLVNYPIPGVPGICSSSFPLPGVLFIPVIKLSVCWSLRRAE